MNESKKSKDIPATHGFVEETRSELKSDIASLRVEMKSEFKKVDAKLDKLTSAVEDQNGIFHRSLALYEEMLQQNKYLLDSLSINNGRLDKIEKLLSSPTA